MEKKFNIKIFVLFLPKVFLKCVLNYMMINCWWNIIVQNGNAKTSEDTCAVYEDYILVLMVNLDAFKMSISHF